MSATVPSTGHELPVFDCEQTVRRLWDYLDGELETVDLSAVDAHLAACEQCPPHFVFEHRFLQAVRSSRVATLTPEPTKTRALRERVVARLAAEGELRHPGDRR